MFLMILKAYKTSSVDKSKICPQVCCNYIRTITEMKTETMKKIFVLLEIK